MLVKTKDLPGMPSGCSAVEAVVANGPGLLDYFDIHLLAFLAIILEPLFALILDELSPICLDVVNWYFWLLQQAHKVLRHQALSRN